MRKIVTLLMLSVYSFATVGTTVAMHFCMGDKVGASLGYFEQASCEFCHMAKHEGDDLNHCCKDENQFIKVTADQEIFHFSFTSEVPVIQIHFGYPILTDSIPNNSVLPSVRAIVPPDIPVYQRNCNFRI